MVGLLEVLQQRALKTELGWRTWKETIGFPADGALSEQSDLALSPLRMR